MTDAQKTLRDLRDRQSRERQRMAELSRVETLSDETRAELDRIEGGTPDLERQIRAAGQAVEQEEAEQRTAQTAGDDPEMRERIELRGRASLAGYLMAAARGRLVSGAEAELQAAAWPNGVPAGASSAAVPMELFDIPENREQRAVADPPGTVGVNLDAIRPFVFAHSIAARLGIEMPRVESGTYASATISTSQSAAAVAKSGAAVGVAGAFTVTTATPKRISARLELTLEDVAAVGQQNFEAILRENLSLRLSDALDTQAINGDGNAPNLAGIFQRLTDPGAPAAGVATFDRFIAQFAGGIDGLWSATTKEVAIVAGVETFQLSAKTFRDIAAADLGATAFSDYAMEHFGGWWTNKRMPAKANHIQQAILYRMGRSMMGGAGAMRTAVCPHWNVIDIDDIYSGSAKGERYFTMHVILGDVILVQPDAYGQVAFRVSVP